MNLRSATSTCISAPWAGDNCDRAGGAAQASHGCCAGPHHPLDRQARSEHAVADLGRAFWFELVVKHCTDLGSLCIELLGHVLAPVALTRQHGLQGRRAAATALSPPILPYRLFARLVARFEGQRQVQLDL